MRNEFRTDLALEAHGQLCGTATRLPGIETERELLRGLPVDLVAVTDERAAKLIGKRIGHYYTLSLPPRFERGSTDFRTAVHASAALLSRCLPKQTRSVLVAALGNPDITPDALGNLAASGILVTRHLRDTPDFASFASVALCRTGVLGTSGTESAAQIRLLCAELKPDAVLVIDALACSDAERLCRTLQFTDTGIAPGSGVGNDRPSLDGDTLGVPVVAVGYPTVMDALSSGSGDALFVTPRSIDSLVRSAARVIAYAVNVTLHGIDVEDVDALIG